MAAREALTRTVGLHRDSPAVDITASRLPPDGTDQDGVGITGGVARARTDCIRLAGGADWRTPQRRVSPDGGRLKKSILPGFWIAFTVKTSNDGNSLLVKDVEDAIGKASDEYSSCLLIDERIGKWIVSNARQTGINCSNELRP